MKLLVKKIESKATTEGSMFPIYRDWDSLVPSYTPGMVYATTINPGFSKGPILHEKRAGYLTAVGGNVILEYLEDGQVKSETISEGFESSFVALIPPGVPVKFKNLSSDQVATIINLPDIAWHPENQDTIKFESWGRCIDHVKE